MTKHEEISTTDATAIETKTKTASSEPKGWLAEVQEKEAIHRQIRNEAVVALKADPFYMIGAKITGYALVFGAATVVLTAIYLGS
ncbi:MAG: hypothetical protein AAGE80_00385 [Pseudomonadota bacterium]